MRKTLAFCFLALITMASRAEAANCAANPYTLTNGTPADANQVMANINNLQTCANGNLAHNGANSDITSLSGLTTPLSIAQGGTGNTTGAPSGNLQAQFITASGNFTIPANTTSSTVFRFLVIGGGGGGGGAATAPGAAASGGMAGCEVIAEFRGFTPGQNVGISVGNGGAGGVGNSAGVAGDSTVLIYASTTILTASGGTSGQPAHSASGIVTSAGKINGNVATATGSGLTLIWSNVLIGYAPTGYGQPGFSSATTGCSGGGGNSSLGAGGDQRCWTSPGNGVPALSYGGGGGGALRGTADVNGGYGWAGVVLVEWAI